QRVRADGTADTRREQTSGRPANRNARPNRSDEGVSLELDRGRSTPKPASSGPATARPQDKVRASGAARRKLKRQAMLDAGVTPERTKRKRSGAPRPAPARRSG
ncbi:MAG: hypothetical protein JWN46_1208, partial [Acidimicrobiales bacterium]|nr:hypothetical protein [Acidimicrobiales bacterium]